MGLRGATVRLAQIHLRSYHPKFIMDACKDIKSSAAHMGIQSSGIIPLPTHKRKYTVLKAPFVYSKARSQIQHDTHKRLIELYGESSTGPDATACVHFLRYLEHDIMQVHPGISVRVTLFSDELAEAKTTSEVTRAVSHSIAAVAEPEPAAAPEPPHV